MSGQILVGAGREIRSIPDDDFRKAIDGIPARMASRLAFMTPEHHLVRDFVVRELPRQNRPLSAAEIARVVGLEEARVTTIVTELEKNLFFLVRDADARVSWAFPVTTTRTAHRMTFSTGEKVFGA